ncbi:MAG: hypothetical protein LBI39_03005 [Puniceicoccales bacterium]|jgi:hypothetical protein|nr:hypothetical protein [Puniceicoccales bacterium]
MDSFFGGHVMGQCLSPDERRARIKAEDEFVSFALPAMVEWAQKAGSETQYGDVREQLELHNLPSGYEQFFCRNILLPALQEDDKISAMEIATLAILYTIGCGGKEEILLASSTSIGSGSLSIRMSATLQGRFAELKFMVFKYLFPKDATVKCVGSDVSKECALHPSSGSVDSGDGSDDF